MEEMSELPHWTNRRIVALLLLLQLLSVYFLWTLNPASEEGEAIFALYLSVDLISLAIISHIFRADKWKSSIRRATLLAGCCFLALLLLFVAFLL
jgi:uncharacterized sodium:solute symporter family permease YidK